MYAVSVCACERSTIAGKGARNDVTYSTNYERSNYSSYSSMLPLNTITGALGCSSLGHSLGSIYTGRS